jgi:NAD(P)-dependent dehydrogenase (short-subunit alcohol dehydrogenase family)
MKISVDGKMEAAEGMMIVHPLITGPGKALFATTERRRALEFSKVDQLQGGLLRLTSRSSGELREDNMSSLTGKTMVVIGGSRGVGRRIVEAGHDNGARVLAVARDEARLKQLAQEVSGVEILALDASDEAAPAKIFDASKPDILVLCAGAFPPAAPLHEQSWHEFSVNWEADVKIAFHFCKAALLQPLPAGSTVILISSGAALAGSPNSGGYAGAKRTQLFMANYSQKESDRLALGLRFLALAPRIMPDTDLGKHAVAGYSRYLGISTGDFVKSMASPPTASDVAAGVIELVTKDASKGGAFIVSGKGLEAVTP